MIDISGIVILAMVISFVAILMHDDDNDDLD